MEEVVLCVYEKGEVGDYGKYIVFDILGYLIKSYFKYDNK